MNIVFLLLQSRILRYSNHTHKKYIDILYLSETPFTRESRFLQNHRMNCGYVTALLSLSPKMLSKNHFSIIIQNQEKLSQERHNIYEAEISCGVLCKSDNKRS